MNIKKITQIAEQINANEDSPRFIKSRGWKFRFIKSRGWKFNKLIKGNEVYGWLTQAEADMLKLAFSLSGKI